jgi:zinc transport system substrate-binding protein
MTMMWWRWGWVLLCGALVLGGWGGGTTTVGGETGYRIASGDGESSTGAGDGPLKIYTVNYPLQYFAQRIGGEHVEVVFPGPGDVDPAFWNPTAEEVSAYQSADLILLNGATYAKWVPKVSLPTSKLVDTSSGFGDRYIQIEDAITHSHGPGGEHAHTGTAFTTWLDPQQAIGQAQATAAAVKRARPAHAESFAVNLAALVADLEALDADLRTLTAGKQDRPLVASHPVYQYLARRYELNLEAVMWEPDTAPTPQQWQELARGLEAHPARWMIWEGEPLPASVARLEDMGVGSLVFDPCGNVPHEGDFLSVMRRNLTALAVGFE